MIELQRIHYVGIAKRFPNVFPSWRMSVMEGETSAMFLKFG